MEEDESQKCTSAIGKTRDGPGSRVYPTKCRLYAHVRECGSGNEQAMSHKQLDFGDCPDNRIRARRHEPSRASTSAGSQIQSDEM